MLRIWERGLACSALDRALEIMAEVEPNTSIEELTRRSIHDRDRTLLAIREATFGADFRAHSSCPACDERLELCFSADALRSESGLPDRSIPGTLRIGDSDVEVRFPDSDDLAAASRCDDVATARRVLASRCLTALAGDTPPIEPDAVSDELAANVARSLDRADAGGGATLEVSCPICHASSEPSFDIASFLWTEIEAEALRTFRDVHRLARGYGWRETDILAMTSLRRRVYLEMLNA
jgi:hypothetical protein